MMSLNVKLARQKLPGLSMTDKIELAHLTLDEIEALQAQLAARNQAAEAMGVLERLVVAIDHETKSWATLVQCEDGKYELRLYKMTDFINGSPAPSITNANSLIEAVLKAGGEDA